MDDTQAEEHAADLDLLALRNLPELKDVKIACRQFGGSVLRCRTALDLRMSSAVWVDHQFADLRARDIFRMYEGSTPVEDERGHTVFRAATNPYFDAWGCLTIEIEENP